MRYLFITATVAVVTLVGCAAPPHERPSASSSPDDRCCRLGGPFPSRNAVVRTAGKLVGAHTIESGGRKIHYDCAGVARAIYLEHGIDLYESRHADGTANGVRLIYAHLRQHGHLHHGPVVYPGDLVFFDNTWDLNGDGLLNDRLTHVGIVETVEDNGTVIFISRVADAVQRYRMNLGFPHIHKAVDGRVLNDYMRRKQTTDSDDRGHLTGELFAFFGTRIGS